MAQLPPDGEWLVQQIGGRVVLFQRHTEYELASWPVDSADATMRAQKVIHDSDLLTDEQKCFAHFWAGYFWAHSRGL